MNDFNKPTNYPGRFFCLLLLSFLISIGSIRAQSVLPAGKVITLHKKQVALEQVIRQVQKQSGIGIFYSNQLLNGKEKVNIRYERVPLKKVLDDLFIERHFEWQYHPDKNTILVRPVKRDGNALMNTDSISFVNLSGVIRGRLVNEKKEPVIATIKVKGTANGATSNEAGQFILKNASDNAVLHISGVNVEPKELKLNRPDTAAVRTKDGNLVITLLSKVNKLQEVTVNTGYQTLSRERSAGAFSSLAGKEVAKKANLTGNILETLDGLIPGLSVNYGTSEEKFLIRGTTSVNSNMAPLVVVDGAVMEGANIESLINSIDIESVTVLKDATAASIWGARSANGVIVITTKKGKAGRIKIGYDGSYTYKGLPDLNYRGLMDSRQLINSAKEIFDPNAYKWTSVTSWQGGALVNPHEMPLYQYANGEITETERDRMLEEMAAYNNRAEIERYFIQPALFSKHAISFDGGNDLYSFYGSAGYEYNQQTERSRYNKYMLNLRQDFRLTKWLKADLTTNLSFQGNKKGISPAHTDWKSVFPYVRFADGQGNFLDHTDQVFYKDYLQQMEEQGMIDLNYVPLSDMNEGFDRGKVINSRVNLGINATLTKGLQYQGRFQYQQNYNKAEIFYSQYSSRVREELARYTKPGTPLPTYSLPTTGGRYNLTLTDGTSWTVRNQLSYDRNFTEKKMQVTAIAGMEINSSLSSVNGSTRRGYDPQSLTYQAYDEKTLDATGITGAVYRAPNSISNRLQLPVFTQSESEMRFVSFYANAGYTYLEKYTLNGSIRVDQSNLFGSSPDVQFKPIWSLGAAWNIKQEDFLQHSDWINNLRLRFSYGLNGNSPTPGTGGPYNLLIASANVAFAGQGPGYAIMYPANDKIRWEHTRVINTGIDVALFDNRISAGIDVYHKLTTGLLSTIPADQTLGWDGYYSNSGDMRNRGFEISLSSRNIAAPEFRWTTVLTFAQNQNKVLKLNTEGQVTASRKIFFDFIEGYAGNSLFAYQWAGLSNNGNPLVYDDNGNVTGNYLDPNLTASAVKYMGVTQPKWYGGLTNTFGYKGFELSFMLVYNLGHKMRNNVNDFWYGRVTRNLNTQFLNRWREPGDENHTSIPKYVTLVANNQSTERYIPFYQNADINVLDASYAKLRDLTLAYKLPDAWSKKLSADNITLRVQAANLVLIAANKQGVDPEYYQYRAGLRGTRYGPTWSLGLNVNFK